MKFILPGGNVKILGKAIHCLAKIGDEVDIEPDNNCLILRTVNLSRSAFATFSFGPSFFTSMSENTEPKDENKCKVMVRSLLLAFRSLTSLEKTVENCILELNYKDCKVVISFKCRHSVSKYFSVGMLDCDNLNAVYDLNSCQNMWKIDSKVMQEANSNFLANQEEVTMYVSERNIKIKNYNDDIDESKQINTELTMLPSEFEQYEINVDTSITFCLKEFRSLLIIADYLNVPINAHFSQGGLPLILLLSQGEFLSSTYVLATLAEDGSSQPAVNSPARNRSQANIRQKVMLHSTQRDVTSQLQPVATPNLSTIPPPDSENLLQFESEPLNFDPTVINDAAEANEGEDCLPASPPAKKKKFLFRRCFDATWNPNKISGNNEVLAPDSDEENS